MTYEEYIAYHKMGDTGVEERMIASISFHLKLSDWDKFRLIYFYTITYHIPSALKLFNNPNGVTKYELTFRTDRRYVKCNGAYERMLSKLSPKMLSNLQRSQTTTDAYNVVSSWFFFGRYASFLFLEVYYHCFNPKWIDDIRFGWEANENYTKGAVSIIQTDDRQTLDTFLEQVKKDTNDNAFSIETSLCAVAKLNKGTRWNGFYTERMLDEAKGTQYESLIYKLANL